MMPNMTLSIPEDLHELMKQQPETNWSAVARKAIRTHAEKWAWIEETLKDSKLTKKDAWDISERIKKDGLKRLQEKGLWPTRTSSSQPSSRKASRGISSRTSRKK